MRTLLVSFGTRPEAIKMAPVVRELNRREGFRVILCLTGQHREMLDQVIDDFQLHVHHDLNVMKVAQSLTHITTAVLTGMEEILKAESPDMVLVHGDTTTTLATALAAFYQQIPVAHVEAGLRTDSLYNPYPEEANRRLTDRLAAVLYAPTPAARDALTAEGADERTILVTGNTVIDALVTTAAKEAPPFPTAVIAALSRPGSKVLVTAHRRESWGEPMRSIARAIEDVCRRSPDTTFIFPIHLNPLVRDIFGGVLGHERNVVFTEPLGYRPFVHLMKAVDVLITDSGGIQEEAPTLGKPVLVMRDTTERPEGIAAGTARLVGTHTETVAGALLELLTDHEAYQRMAAAVNPYGDGFAAARIADHLEHRFQMRPEAPFAFLPPVGN
ncbi:MAG: non-hydrolyzing UDP-N-acetylglucosamine 2-epimerase [Thermoleophilia bacterium]